jgi:hypothetical protein
MRYQALIQTIRLITSKKYRTKKVGKVIKLIQENPEIRLFLINCYRHANKHPSKRLAFAIGHESNTLFYGIQEGYSYLFVKAVHGYTE